MISEPSVVRMTLARMPIRVTSPTLPQPADNKEECEIAAAICECQDSYVRCNNHIAEMFGLLAPKEGNGSRSVTATQINVGGQVDEVQFLKNLVRYKELKQENGQQRDN
jgi:hypothetical protein